VVTANVFISGYGSNEYCTTRVTVAAAITASNVNWSCMSELG